MDASGASNLDKPFSYYSDSEVATSSSKRPADEHPEGSRASKRARSSAETASGTDNYDQESENDDEEVQDPDKEDRDVLRYTLNLVLEVPYTTKQPGRTKKDPPKTKTHYNNKPLLSLPIYWHVKLRRDFYEPIASHAGLDPAQIDWANTKWRYEGEAKSLCREVGSSTNHITTCLNNWRPKKGGKKTNPLPRDGAGSSRTVWLQLSVHVQADASTGAGAGGMASGSGQVAQSTSDEVAGRANPLRNVVTPGIAECRAKLEAFHYIGRCPEHPNRRCVKNANDLHFFLDSAKLSSWAAILHTNPDASIEYPPINSPWFTADKAAKRSASTPASSIAAVGNASQSVPVPVTVPPPAPPVQPTVLAPQERYSNAISLEDFCAKYHLVGCKDKLEQLGFCVGDTLDNVKATTVAEYTAVGFRGMEWRRVLEAVEAYWNE